SPMTDISQPLYSYGCISMLYVFISIGLLFNIIMRRHIFYYSRPGLRTLLRGLRPDDWGRVKIRRVEGGFDVGVPVVTLTKTLPQSRAARAFDVQLAGAEHFPAERRVVIRLRIVERGGDAFLEAMPSPLQLGKPR